MPLIKINQTSDESAWALWFASESELELASLINEVPDSSIIHRTKRVEWLAGRAILQQLTKHFGLQYFGTEKDEFGRPYLKNQSYHISLSHSFPYIAAQIDLTHEIGIDLEQPKPKLFSVAHRILAPAELNDAGNDMVKHCVYWCAKESLFKAYGKKGLFFSDHIQVDPFILKNSGEILGRINFNNDQRDITLSYLIQPDYVLVYTKH